jgi:hypothetical protein
VALLEPCRFYLQRHRSILHPRLPHGKPHDKVACKDYDTSMDSETTACKDNTLIPVTQSTAMTKRRFHQSTMHDRTTKRVHNRWMALTASKATIPSDWDQAARKPINDLLEDLHTDEELEEREKRRAIFPFFELPREIRDEIYHYAWSSSVFCYYHEDFNSIACPRSLYEGEGQTVVVRYGTDLVPDSIETFPKWVGTHPLLEQEAMQQLHRGAIFSILGRDLTVCWMPLQSGGPDQCLVPVGAGTAIIVPKNLKYIAPLLSLRKAAKVQVWGNSASRGHASGSCSFCAYNWKAKQETKHALFPVLAGPSDRFEGLRELDLVLTLPDFHHVAGEDDDETGYEKLHWDFSLFDKLPRSLKRLSIRLYRNDCARHEHDWNSTFRLWQKVRQECADRAKSFLQELSEGEEGVIIKQGMEPRKQCSPWIGQDVWFCDAVNGHYKWVMDQPGTKYTRHSPQSNLW